MSRDATPSTPTSTRALAAILGVSKSTIHRDVSGKCDPGARVVGRDGKTYPATRLSLRPSDELVELRMKGWSYRRIAAEFGVSHQTVMRLFRNGGSPVPDGTREPVDQAGAR
jgi:IS30 family transposase